MPELKLLFLQTAVILVAAWLIGLLFRFGLFYNGSEVGTGGGARLFSACRPFAPKFGSASRTNAFLFRAGHEPAVPHSFGRVDAAGALAGGKAMTPER